MFIDKKKLGAKVATTKIRECTALKESQAEQESLFDYAPRSNASIEKKNKMVCLRIKPSIWELVGRLAYADSRTKSSIVELAIKEYADRHSI